MYEASPILPPMMKSTIQASSSAITPTAAMPASQRFSKMTAAAVAKSARSESHRKFCGPYCRQ